MEIKYKAQGRSQSLQVTPLAALPARGKGMRPAAASGLTTEATEASLQSVVELFKRTPRLASRVSVADADHFGLVNGSPSKFRPAGTKIVREVPSTTITLMTPSLIVEGASAGAIKAARKAGAQIVEEGSEEKILLRVEELAQVPAMMQLLTRLEVSFVTPNFVRCRKKPGPSAPATLWAHLKLDVASAWKTTKGVKEVRVAVLDEGVDTKHPDLSGSVVGERDFIGGKGNSAMPDGDDAHGTACAGIIVSGAFGIAPACSLVAARIAMDDGQGNWVFDDFATADAIDWAWNDQKADVLSNSWGGGTPSDAIIRAFERASTKGRRGKGSVVCIAAGNDQNPIDFPGNRSDFVTVGASNQWDERKTRSSKDGERNWGSNYGPTLWVLAPGVSIQTTDIKGARGYDPGDTTLTFNGTSAATPHVAAAAALMVSANATLTATAVRTALAKTAVRLSGQTSRTDELGHGRLSVGAAVAAAVTSRLPSKGGQVLLRGKKASPSGGGGRPRGNRPPGDQ